MDSPRDSQPLSAKSMYIHWTPKGERQTKFSYQRSYEKSHNHASSPPLVLEDMGIFFLFSMRNLSAKT